MIEKPKVATFEYRSHYSGDLKTLNAFGAEGWELVLYDGGSYVFKRERK